MIAHLRHTANGSHMPPSEMDLIAALHARIAELERSHKLITERLDALGQMPQCPYIVIFTKRENAVLQAMWNGDTSAKMIAHRLVLSERTVQTHFERMFKKTGVQDRVALILWAMRQENGRR